MMTIQRRGVGMGALLLLLCGMLLLAPVTGCGGGGDGGGNDTPGAAYTLGDRGIIVKNPAAYQTGQKDEDVRPFVYSITPSSGPASGGTPVTIKGKNFLAYTGTDGLRIASVAARNFTNVVFVDDETITAVTPAVQTRGANQVYVANLYGDNTWGESAALAWFDFTD